MQSITEDVRNMRGTVTALKYKYLVMRGVGRGAASTNSLPSSKRLQRMTLRDLLQFYVSPPLEIYIKLILWLNFTTLKHVTIALRLISFRHSLYGQPTRLSV
jgi:hypothetical protein